MPAESILNLESKPLFLTKSVKTPSAAGLLQMLPKHTNRTEKGLVSVSVSVEGVEAAIEALLADPGEKEAVNLTEVEWQVEVWRDGKSGRRT